MKLEKCSGCNGFVPSSVSACPHCQSKRTTRLGAVAVVLGSSAIAFTLMACYGAPPGPNGPPPEAPTTPTPPATPNADGGK